MAFVLPEGLAPEVYPLAWVVGRWQGEGVVSYPGIEDLAFTQSLVFDHDGGPYLRYESTLRVRSGPDDWRVWSTETGYWRVAPERGPDLTADQHPLEVLLSDPSGHVTVYLGAVGSGRIDLVSDLIARTSTAAEVTASRRVYGLVDGELMWAWDLAAFGHHLQSYASARLSRVDDPIVVAQGALDPKEVR
jgi:hypothetical protein